jgi:hypothetical protein
VVEGNTPSGRQRALERYTRRIHALPLALADAAVANLTGKEPTDPDVRAAARLTDRHCS